jgi:hypothetical protein
MRGWLNDSDLGRASVPQEEIYLCTPLTATSGGSRSPTA